MRTRSSSNLIVEYFMIPKRRNRRRSKQIVKPELRTIVETPVATMADTRTMSEILQAPTEGYRDAIVLPPILAEYFELKVGLHTLVTSSQFRGFERDDSHSHIRGLTRSLLRLTLVKAIEEIYVTCGGPHPYYECPATDNNTFNASAATWTYNQGSPVSVVKSSIKNDKPQGRRRPTEETLYLLDAVLVSKVKENQEKDKIRSKPDKNGKRGEAGKSQKQLQSIKQEKLKKMQVEGPKVQSLTKFYSRKKKRRTRFASTLKFQQQGPDLPMFQS
nr:reverse transcriptase domain-containing protein [Tanacetum cinerariifolium]